MQQNAAKQQHGGAPLRGIWRAQFLQDGYPVIIAVDSRGRCVGSIVLHRGLSPSRVRRILTELLDAVDPQFKLRLLTDTATA